MSLMVHPEKWMVASWLNGWCAQRSIPARFRVEDDETEGRLPVYRVTVVFGQYPQYEFTVMVSMSALTEPGIERHIVSRFVGDARKRGLRIAGEI